MTPEVLRSLALLPRLLLLPIRKLAGPLKGLAASLKSTVASLETTWEDAAYGAPAYGAPEPSYGAPAPSYGASGYARSVRKETFGHQYHMALSYSVPVPRGRRASVKVGVKQVRIRSRISSSASNQPRQLGRPHRTKTAPIGSFLEYIFIGYCKVPYTFCASDTLHLVWVLSRQQFFAEHNSQYHNFAESLHGQIKEKTRDLRCLFKTKPHNRKQF